VGAVSQWRSLYRSCCGSAPRRLVCV